MRFMPTRRQNRYVESTKKKAKLIITSRTAFANCFARIVWANPIEENQGERVTFAREVNNYGKMHSSDDDVESLSQYASAFPAFHEHPKFLMSPDTSSDDAATNDSFDDSVVVTKTEFSEEEKSVRCDRPCKSGAMDSWNSVVSRRCQKAFELLRKSGQSSEAPQQNLSGSSQNEPFYLQNWREGQ